MINEQELRQLEKQLKQNVRKAAIHLVNKLKENLNTAAPNRKRHVGSKSVYYTAEHSQAGDFPFKIQGFLQRSITYEMGDDGFSAKVGSTLKGSSAYSTFLEFGTSSMQARPWLRPTFFQERETLEAILRG